MPKDEAWYWDEVARKWPLKTHSDELLLEHKRKAHLDLVAKWAESGGRQRVLKTDLFEEAFGSDQFLFDLAKERGNMMGMDISVEITSRAKRRATYFGVDFCEYICCDIRQLPFRSNSIDLVISNSTLDHFHDEREIIAALKELRRVLTAGGTLILTMDNKSNLGEPIHRLWALLGLAPFFIGKAYSVRELRRIVEGVGFRIEDATAIIHRPWFSSILIARLLRRLDNRRFDPKIRKALAFSDSLEKRKTKYLTGLYIAVKAVKGDTT